MPSKKLPIFIKTFSWAAAFCLATPSLHATAYIVNQNTDTNLGTGGNFVTATNTDLRGALNNINQNPGTHTVTFALGASNTITLNAMLPILNLVATNNLTINGFNGGTQIVIDGASTYRGFFAEQGTIALQNLTIQNVTAVGGTGGAAGGGGGMGAGSGLFIDKASVTVSNVSINNASSIGGSGGSTVGVGTSGGGGGMGGNGGDEGNSSENPGGGGGGLGGNGASGSPSGGGGGGGGINCGTNHTGAGVSGGNGTTGGGIGGTAAGNSAGAGTGGASGGGGGSGNASEAGGGGGLSVSGNNGVSSNVGGNGGFGGGGGAPTDTNLGNIGGNGGFGGGGSGKVGGSTGGNGGFGGGGGGSGAAGAKIGGTGGFGGGGGSGDTGGLGGIGGGWGSSGSSGAGGGAGFGGALFVNQPGSLTILGTFSTAANSTNFGAGTGLVNPGSQGWNGGDTGFFLTGSTINFDPNGSTITISNSIGDDSAGSFTGAPVGVTKGTATGAAIIVGNAANPAGTTNLNSASTYSGGTTLNKGTLKVANNTAMGSGSLTFASTSGNILQSGAAALNVANAIILNANGNVDSNGNTFTLSGNISGGSAFTKQNTGTVILSGTNTYGGGTNISAGTLTINTAASIPATTSVNIASATSILNVAPVAGTVTIGDLTGVASSSVNLGTSTLVFGTSTASVTYPGNISGASGSLTKQGSGIAILSGTNNYTGGTTVSAGTLTINTAASLPTGTNVNTSSATSVLNVAPIAGTVTIGNLAGVAGSSVNLGTSNLVFGTPTASVTYAGNIGGTSSSLTKQGSGIAVLSGTNTYNGGTTVSAGTLTINTAASLPTGTNVNTSSATSVLNVAPVAGTVTIGDLTGVASSSVNLGTSTLVFGTSTASVTYPGNISGASGFLTKQGSGIAILSGTNNYTGGTTVSAGTLTINTAASLPTGTNVNTSSATSILNVAPIAGTVTIGDLTGVAGSSVNLGTSNLVFGTSTASATYAGNIGGTSSSLTKQGSGIAILSGSNNYTGLTTVSAGTLQISSTTALPSGGNVNTAASGATLDLTGAGGSITIGDLTGVALSAVNLGTSNLTLGTATPTVTYNGNINSSGSLTKQGSGIFVLSANNTYSGGTTINAGAFTVTGTIGGPVLVNSAGTFNADNTFTITDFTGVAGGQANVPTGNTLTFGTANSTTWAGDIAGSGNLVKQGTGTFSVSGTNTFAGVFDVNQGTLNMGGTFPAASTTNIATPATLAGTGTLGVVNLNGTLSPGNSIGTINAVDFTFNTGSNFLLELNDTASDKLVASGTVTIDPGATISLVDLGLSSPLNQYTIITSGLPLVGTGNFTLVNPLPRFNFMLGYDLNNVFLILNGVNPTNPFVATGNAGKAANAFNHLLDTDPDAPGLQEVVDVLNLQTRAQWQKSFNQMQPANMDNIAFAQENVGELIRRTFTTRLFQQRLEACPKDDPYRLWIVPFIEHAHQNGRGQLSGYKEDTRGLSTGFDYQFEKHWAISTGFSFAHTDVTITSGRAHGNFKTYAGTVAAIWENSNIYVDGLFSYFFNSVDAKRKMRFSAPGVSTVQRKAKHDNGINALMGHIGTGYDYKVIVDDYGTVNIYPFVSVDYLFLMQQRYAEKQAGALDLVVYSKDYDLLRPEGGIGFGYGGCFESVNLNVDFTASYIREQRFLGKKTKTRFKYGEKDFTVRGLNPRNNLFGMGGNITVGSARNTNVSVSLGYYGEFGSRFIENSGEVEIRVAF